MVKDPPQIVLNITLNIFCNASLLTMEYVQIRVNCRSTLGMLAGMTISNLTTEGFFDLNSSICLGMIAWPETIFLTDNGFFRPPATLALTVSPLGVSRDFVWNETRSISFSQGLRFQKS